MGADATTLKLAESFFDVVAEEGELVKSSLFGPLGLGVDAEGDPTLAFGVGRGDGNLKVVYAVNVGAVHACIIAWVGGVARVESDLF